ncbi:MAG: hypothetical protein ABIA75_02025 [Candidatus Neomarinimicrobiota bacterium]
MYRQTVGKSDKYTILALLIFFIWLVICAIGCREPAADPLECGPHQILSTDGQDCQCESGYHWNDDQTECLRDTTSHNFVWEIDSFGVSLSYFNNVTITDDGEIWAVGKISNDSTYFGAIVWDGENWNIVQLDGPTVSTPSLEPNAIKYFSENDIWFAAGSIFHYDGLETNIIWQRDFYNSDESVTELWAHNENDIYFVGDEGTIVYWDGSSCEKLETPNYAKLISVSGSSDGEYVFAAGYDIMIPTNTTALMIHEGVVEELYYADYLRPQSSSDLGAISSVSVWGDTAYFVTRQGLWKYNYLTEESIIDNGIYDYSYRALMVQSPNDIYMVGGGFQYVHYNGAAWDHNNQLFDEYDFSSNSGAFFRDTAVIVGYLLDGSRAIIAVGRR